jgi:rod shape-determining protein MreD
MNRPQYILQPVNPYFIVFSLAAAFLLNLMPWGRLPGVPDFVALVLLFWNIHQPRKVGMGVAFALGILMDVHDAAARRACARLYAAVVRCDHDPPARAVVPIGVQVLYVTPLLVGAQLVPFVIRLMMGAAFPGWRYLVDGFVEAALWPIASHLLLMPQRRPVDPDDTRPI